MQTNLPIIKKDKNKPIVYIDMDDTAVNYMKQHEKYRVLYPKYEYAQSVIGFFATIEPMPGFMQAWHDLSEYYDLRILTRPSMDNLNSYTEKAQWVRDHLGAKALLRLNICPDKSLLIGDYLIDDWTIHGQTDFQGEFLQFGYGENCRTWKDVTEYLMSKIEK